MPKNKYTLVIGVICPRCGDIIFSRANHDFHYCTCGGIMVDGGLDYLRYGSMSEDVDFKAIKTMKLYILADKKELYDDWNFGRNKYGVIKNDEEIINET